MTDENSAGSTAHGVRASVECPHERATGDEFNGRCPDCGVTWQTVQATGDEDLRDTVGVAATAKTADGGL